MDATKLAQASPSSILAAQPSLPDRDPIVLAIVKIAALAAACALAAGCSAHQRKAAQTSPSPAQTLAAAPTGQGAEPLEATATAAPASRKVAAKTPARAARKLQRYSSGLASWYGARFHGRPTANGERFDMHGFTAAHPTAPLPSYMRVTNVSNGRSLVLRVNDRGPYHRGRVIDVSKRAAEVLGFTRTGVGNVTVDLVGRAPQDARDDRKLIGTYQEFGRPAAPEGVQVAAFRPIADVALAAEAAGGPAGPSPVLVASANPVAVPQPVIRVASAPTAVAASAPPAPATASSAPVRVATAPQPPAEARVALAKAAASPAAAQAKKRVVAPQDPVLASAAPTIDAPSAKDGAALRPSKVDVASRIAATFEGFGDAAFATGGGQGLESGAAAYAPVR